jgi:hypothetical protein
MSSLGKFVAKMGLLSALSVMPLAAQIDNGVVFTAPFSFYAGNVELPAGSYKVTHLDMTTKMVLVRNIASMNGVVVNVTVKSSVNPFKETDVTFDKYGDTGYLRGVSVARETDGLEFGRSNAETKAAATATKAENTKVVEHAALMRGK